MADKIGVDAAALEPAKGLLRFPVSPSSSTFSPLLFFLFATWLQAITSLAGGMTLVLMTNRVRALRLSLEEGGDGYVVRNVMPCVHDYTRFCHA